MEPNGTVHRGWDALLESMYWDHGRDLLGAAYLATLILSLLAGVYAAHVLIGRCTRKVMRAARDRARAGWGGGDETLRSVHRWCYIANFIAVNTMVFMSVSLIVITYDIDFTMIVYTIGSVAIFISVFCGTIYVPYLESFKIVFSGRVEYGKTYDLMSGGKAVHQRYTLHRIYTFYIIWREVSGRLVSMPVGKLSSMEVAESREEK